MQGYVSAYGAWLKGRKCLIQMSRYFSYCVDESCRKALLSNASETSSEVCVRAVNTTQKRPMRRLWCLLLLKEAAAELKLDARMEARSGYSNVKAGEPSPSMSTRLWSCRADA